MSLFDRILHWHLQLARALDWLRSPLLLGTRLWVSWQFLLSGRQKLASWETTLELFRSEYQVPLLPPNLAAVAGTFGEIFFPLLLIVGLSTRLGALGLFAVNAMALISYWHVLGGEGFEAARGQHYLWGFMLAVIVAFGPGALSLDALLAKRQKR